MSINVFIPTINPEKANKYANLMQYRAGYPCEIIIMEDKERIGWVAMINKMKKLYPADYYVYAADDAFPSRGFIKEGLETLVSHSKGLLGFNEGKYQELNAGFGMVSHEWIETIYGDDLLYKGYKSHFADPELTLIAKSQNMFVYNPRTCLIEVDFEKDGEKPKGNRKDDHDLFFERLETGFDGRIRPMIRSLVS